jgi:non-specific serine/threonine protein kinase
VNGRVVRLAAAFVAAVLVFGACTDDGGTLTPLAWRRIADAPTERQEVAAAVVGEKIYVVGGLVSNGATAAVEIYDPASDSWTTGPPLPLAVHHAMAAEQGGRLFVMGGFAISRGGAAIRDVFILEDGRWREGPPLRRPRGAGAAASVGGRIVVAGGIDGDRHVGPVEILDEGAWHDGAPIPSLRDHLGAATQGSLLFAVGGRRGGAHFGTFEVYDPAADRWSKLPDMPTARSGNGAAFAAGRVISAGGEGPRIFPEVESYDPTTRTWTRLPDLAAPVHGVGLAAVGMEVYAFVGGDKVGLAPTRACQVLAVE